MHRGRIQLLIIFFISVLPSACTDNPRGLFGKKSEHETYSEKLAKAGIKETALGRLWFTAANESLTKPLTVTIPYSEAGYFSANKPEAVGLRFKVKRGEKLDISITIKPAIGFLLFMDLWDATEEGKATFLSAADTASRSINFEVRKDGFYLLRLQPELLASGEYTLSISSGPSLAFPVPAKAKPNIGSFWGVSRDAGARRHEGIDIFAAFRTPLVAAADGTVSRVTDNALGGKVIFFRPSGKDYTLYYAHLDKQLVDAGQSLKKGDTLGLMGNTGNARSTPPHLHFGIYASGGAIDPLAFVNPIKKKPAKITAPADIIGQVARTGNRQLKLYHEPFGTSSNAVSVAPGSLVRVQSSTANWYKVVLPNGETGFIESASVTSTKSPLKKIVVKLDQGLVDAPNPNAARKMLLEKGDTVDVLAAFKDYYFVSTKEEEGWIPKAEMAKR
jgi:murein DD-endopeptidase MepM/ murein hydrolase activator NlpD